MEELSNLVRDIYRFLEENHIPYYNTRNPYLIETKRLSIRMTRDSGKRAAETVALSGGRYDEVFGFDLHHASMLRKDYRSYGDFRGTIFDYIKKEG